MKSKTERMHFPHKLYILMRNDLPSMNNGKAMAQAAHAANDFVYRFGEVLPAVTEDWMSKDYPFGTTIVLAVDQYVLNDRIKSAAAKSGVPCGFVWDQTYPYTVANKELADLIDIRHHTAPYVVKENGSVIMFRNEVTCGYIFVVDGSSNQEELVGDLSLLC